MSRPLQSLQPHFQLMKMLRIQRLSVENVSFYLEIHQQHIQVSKVLLKSNTGALTSNFTSVTMMQFFLHSVRMNPLFQSVTL
jgi:hypothetical protein